MPSSDDDRLLAELRRLVASMDPVPVPVKAAACAVFAAPPPPGRTR